MPRRIALITVVILAAGLVAWVATPRTFTLRVESAADLAPVAYSVFVNGEPVARGVTPYEAEFRRSGWATRRLIIDAEGRIHVRLDAGRFGSASGSFPGAVAIETGLARIAVRSK